MPLRSLNSSVLVWPNRAHVDEAVRRWARAAVAARPDVRRLGYFGSYARGDWGVGSDLDLVAIVNESHEVPEHRALTWDLTSLPVPAEMVIYTEREWRDLAAAGGRFSRVLQSEAVWLFP